MKKNSKKHFGRKLKAYTAITTSVIAADVSSQVRYHNIQDTTLVNNGDFFDIDFNNDGILDVRVSLSQFTSSYPTYSYYYYRNSVLAVGLSYASAEINVQLNSYSYYEAAAFNLNSSIGSSVNSFLGYGYLGVIRGTSNSFSSYVFSSGQFPGSGQKFVGAKFNIGTAVHYGWIRMDVPSNSQSVTIFDFAYDTTANNTILAGDTGLAVGIDELNSEKIELYASEAVLHFPNSLNKTFDLRVYDLKGQLQEITRVAAGSHQYSLKRFYNGIYIVELKNEEGTFRKKLWLESK